ncbi:MAG: hypothetical protein PHV59_02145 [Victivallales bacterium]|nr:hypothetical protein [Victivallales bacterium]
MIRIVEFSINEILIEEKACSDLITRTCLRQLITPYRVTGLCSSEDKIFVILEQSKLERSLPEYRFARLGSLDSREIEAEIHTRYNAGFRTIGSFLADDQVWALFAREKP